jgi:class 3 adenylate cyclase
MTPDAFDHCHSRAMVSDRMAIIAAGLIQPDAAAVSPEDLWALRFSDAQKHPNPVLLLSEICRLLIRMGDSKSLARARKTAHTLFHFKTGRNESWFLHYLYKGMAEIGLGQFGIGFKNVQVGLRGGGGVLYSEDRALGHWALAGSALQQGNLRAARGFVRQWLELAEQRDLRCERFRARAVRQLLRLLDGRRDRCARGLETLRADVPAAWAEVADYLADWTEALVHRRAPVVPIPEEPLPLLPGVEWLSGDGEFAGLCRALRAACDPARFEGASPEEIRDLAALAARWELPGPLRRFERILEKKEPRLHHRFVLARMLGAQLMERIVDRKSEDPEVEVPDDAVILAMDVRGYSKWRHDPVRDFEILNPLFKLINRKLEAIGGNIVEFKGDAIIVAFNAFADTGVDFAEILHRAVAAMRDVRLLSLQCLESGLPEVQVGMGLNRGPLATGFLGGLDRCFLTPLGDTINTAARLESRSKEVPGDLVLSLACFDGREPEVWTRPFAVNYALRELGSVKGKNIAGGVPALAARPLVPYWVDFCPMGFVAEPEDGVVYIDTGNADRFGIIDHHHAAETAGSACELLVRRPELLHGHLLSKAVSPDESPRDHLHIRASRVEFRLHEAPDIDCCATFHAACELLDRAPRRELLAALAEYVSRIDQGRIPEPDHLEDSLYGVFIAHQHRAEKKFGPDSDFHRLEAGLRVVDAALFLMERTRLERDFATIFQLRPDWFAEERALIGTDRKTYLADKRRGATYKARVNRGDDAVRVEGLWLARPESLFFKQWARTDPRAPGASGYGFLAVDRSDPEDAETGNRRFVFSVDPESGAHLKGLGEALERRETERRTELDRPRPLEPRRLPADNADPWYFGQGHDFTIVDAPRAGTVLTAEEVRAIHENW